MPPRVRRELLPANNPGLALVPQLLCRNPDDFVWAARELFDMGYAEVNLNLGCPSGTVAAKGKGAGFLAFPDELDEFFERVFSELPGANISVKTRLGLEDEAEFARLLDIFARRPISELIVHTRVRADWYKLPARPDTFAAALGRFPGPAVYNGDLFTVADYQQFCQAFPDVQRVMLGRGWIANPDLGNQIRGKAMLDKTRLRGFHDELYAAYREGLSGETPVLFKMKELWFYQHWLFTDSDRPLKKIRKAKRLRDYEAAVDEMFGHPLLPDAGYRPVR